jgi:recombination endonuclease VII
MSRAEFDRKRYAEDPDYRARKLAANRKWNKANREHINEWKRRVRNKKPEYREKHCRQLAHGRRRAKYGLTPEDFERLLQRQNGACGICKVRPAETLSVDHDHVTNAVRGLLCRPCNTGLGAFGDNPRLMLKAIAYLADARGLVVVARLIRWALWLTGHWIERAFRPRLAPPAG